ncbi:MAG: GGDEF domain-containing protein [Pseudomonadota bacterium]
MRKLGTWRDTLIDIINWNAVDRGLLPLGLGLPLFVQVLCWYQYVLSRPDRDTLIDIGFASEAMSLIWLMIGMSMMLLAIGWAIRKRHPDVAWFQYVTTLFYALAMTYLSWTVGTMTLMTGVVMLGAPVAGFILLERGPVVLAFLTAFGLSIALSVASARGLVPYAPLVMPPATPEATMFWTLSTYFLSLIPIVVLIVLADRALSSWRQREAGIHAISRTDALTGIHNRRSILELLDKEIARTRRHGPPLAVVILDLDHFKSVNDTRGHPTGDRVLQHTAAVLQRTVRQCDAIGRYGGEEFLLLLPDTSLEGAQVLAERCRERLAAEIIADDQGQPFSISGSFGLACNEHCYELAAGVLIKAADDALYRAKHGGRNRVEGVAPPAPAP